MASLAVAMSVSSVSQTSIARLLRQKQQDPRVRWSIVVSCWRTLCLDDDTERQRISDSISESNYSVSVGGYADPDPEPPEPDLTDLNGVLN
ncbi:unnamed protein product [Fusarium graminearum]|uniref:Chromosome 3, complete genome n=2 Tax=Gibberella zeae TaxID=5518 RepID=A0A0E0SPI3_GIBZE|nr:hypothetical protein FG05_35194 [Fusarium graminearum]CAF3529580.1 unnamed protein product [Fusarium graminearum]CAF3588788.1 unnamed protein product [Fusarium graminearum]CAG1964313.1 unnamed protein product [Fusarium graminearum]CAG1966418.1 unnamed protein product [Fusarium graminearum]